MLGEASMQVWRWQSEIAAPLFARHVQVRFEAFKNLEFEDTSERGLLVSSVWSVELGTT